MGKDIGTEFSEVLKHLEDFLEQFDSEEHIVADSSWVRKGAINSYGLLLVAHPIKAADGTTKAYINRAKERAEKKIHHLYVFGTQEEAAFVKKVIKGIQEVVDDYELQEEFTLHRDYRGDKGGHGALFALKAN